MKSWIRLVLSVLFCFGALSIVSAQEPAERPLLAKPFMKLARGAVNMISAPLEIPNQMYILSEHADENSRYGIEPAAGAIEGLFTGTGFALWRLVVGAYDLITFPVPVYESCLMYPTYITVSYEAYYEPAKSIVSGEDNRVSPALSEEEGIPSPENAGKDAGPPSSPEEDTVPASGPEVE